MIQAERSWRKGVRTHISLDVANPSGPLFQVSFTFLITAFLRAVCCIDVHRRCPDYSR